MESSTLIIVAVIAFIILTPYVLNAKKKRIIQQKDFEYQKLYKELEKEKALNAEIGDKEILLEQLDQQINVKLVTPSRLKELDSLELRNELADKRKKTMEDVHNGEAVDNLGFQGSKRAYNAITNAMLRAFNSDCETILTQVTLKNIEKAAEKIEKSYEAINKIFKYLDVQINSSYLKAKRSELVIFKAYLERLEIEKEVRRAEKERIAEEQKAIRELNAKRELAEKDRKQYENQLKKQQLYLSKAKDESERQLYQDQIKDLQDKINGQNELISDIEHREANAKAGYVYIISNIGSFGDQIFKIGMTRRMDPQERIDELGSASVPFKFDTHAVIFSEDAPALEATLHRHFDAQRVNKVNLRKEFFKVDLKEIEAIAHESDKTAKFVYEPEAYEYRKSIELEQE